MCKETSYVLDRTKNINDLISENTGLIDLSFRKLGISFMLRKSYSERDDIWQYGLVGLWKAINGYDETKDISFSTYAVACITHELIKFLRRRYNYPIIKSNSVISFESLCRSATETSNDSRSSSITNDQIAVDHKSEDAFSDIEFCTEELLLEYLDKFEEPRRSRLIDIFTMRLEGCTCEAIGLKYNVSKQYINQLLHKYWDKFDAATKHLR